MKSKILLSFCSMSLLCVSTLYSAETPDKSPVVTPSPSGYLVKDYRNLMGMKGFSTELLTLHLKLYEGYVKNVNMLMMKIQNLSTPANDTSYDYGALKRRLAWEYDGMRLHELYFDNLGGTGEVPFNDPLIAELKKTFGSYDAWKQDFTATGLIRGIGWVVLYRDNKTGRLFNTWINEHDGGHLVEATPIVIMDVFEHAYITQYGLDKASYIQAFFSNLNWPIIIKRAKS